MCESDFDFEILTLRKTNRHFIIESFKIPYWIEMKWRFDLLLSVKLYTTILILIILIIEQQSQKSILVFEKMIYYNDK